MSPTGRVVIPILFVVLLIFVLGRPILVSSLDVEEDEPAPVSTPRGTDEKDESSGPSRLARPYPRACLRPAQAPGLGLVAATRGGSIGVGSPDGQAAFALRAEPPVGFSADGRFLATAGADLWSDRGAHLGLAFKRPVTSWAWAPTGSCLVGIERGRLMVVRPERAPEVLVRGVPVSDFSFSPDGSRLVFAVSDESSATGIWMADLKSRDVRSLLDETGWLVTAWSRAMRPIMLQEGPGSRSRDGLSFGPSDEVAYCGSEVITVRRERLATFGVSGVPTYLQTDRRFRYSGVSCSPRGDLLMTIRYPKGDPTATTLAVLRIDGSFVEEFGQDSAIEDQPMWGPAGTGVVFVGGTDEGPLVWFLPEGGEERTTGLRVERFGDQLDSTLDWSATPPLGHPTD